MLVYLNLLKCLPCVATCRVDVALCKGILNFLIFARSNNLATFGCLDANFLEGVGACLLVANLLDLAPESRLDVGGHCSRDPMLDVDGEELWVKVFEVLNLPVLIDHRTVP